MNVTVPVTQNVTLTCVGQGYGFVSVNWIRGSNKRPPPTKSTVTTMIMRDSITSILTIPNIMDRDGKHFRCIYNNSGGETDSNVASLIIGGTYLKDIVTTILQ